MVRAPSSYDTSQPFPSHAFAHTLSMPMPCPCPHPVHAHTLSMPAPCLCPRLRCACHGCWAMHALRRTAGIACGLCLRQWDILTAGQWVGQSLGGRCKGNPLHSPCLPHLTPTLSEPFRRHAPTSEPSYDKSECRRAIGNPPPSARQPWHHYVSFVSLLALIFRI